MMMIIVIIIIIIIINKVYTHTEVKANRPVIIIKNKKEKTCIMIEVAIPAGKNVSRKEVKK
jgi:hypothetical protein